MATSVGMRSTIFGMNLAENSARAGIESRPRIGPTTSPTNRSMPVHSPPPATWLKSSPQLQLKPIDATRKPSTTATTGRPLSGTIWMTGRGGAIASCPPPAPATVADPVSVAVAKASTRVSVMIPPPPSPQRKGRGRRGDFSKRHRHGGRCRATCPRPEALSPGGAEACAGGPEQAPPRPGTLSSPRRAGKTGRQT